MTPTSFIHRLLLLSFLFLFLISCKKDFTLSTSADDFFYLKYDGYYLPVMVRGNTESHKILLFVQGGPALNALDFARIDYPGWKNTLEKDYAVAYYEPSGMGNRQGTFDINDICIDKYLEDIHQVATILQEKYNAEVDLLGHSFGGYLTYGYMIKYGGDDVVKKFIVADGPATTDYDTLLRWGFRHDFLVNEANESIANGNTDPVWQEILQWCADHPVLDTNEEFIQWNKYVEENIYINYPEKLPTIRDYATVLFFSSYNPLTATVNGGVAGTVEDQLNASTSSYDMVGKLPAVNQPVLIFTGRHDDVCPPEELEYIYNTISSTDKTMYIIQDAGHESFNDQPEEFRNIINDFVD
jgi:pimeloyl-ACP methyl ester carboxylesterase